MIGLFGRILSLLQGSFAKETYNFIDPTNQSHPQCAHGVCLWCVLIGWLWLVGSIKLQVSFAKEPYKRDNILPKRPII